MPLNHSPTDMHQHIPHSPDDEQHVYDHPDHALTRRNFLTATVGAMATVLGCHDSTLSPMSHTEHHLSPEQAELLEQYWAADQQAFDEIAEIGFQEYVKKHNLAQKHLVFTPAEAETMEVAFCCSDEGIEDHDHILVRTPGSLMIQAKDREDKNPLAPDFVDWVAKEALGQDATLFKGHTRCGAGREILKGWLHAQRKIKDPPTKGEQEKYLSWDQVDAFVQAFTDLVVRRMQELAGGKADRISGGFIEKLTRPSSLHPGRCLYLTNVKNFDSTCPGLPRGYVETILHIDNLTDALDHIEVLSDIALGDHGVGSKVTEEPSKQFVICCIAETQEELHLLKKDAQVKIDALRAKRPAVAKKLRIDGFALTA